MPKARAYLSPIQLEVLESQYRFDAPQTDTVLLGELTYSPTVLHVLHVDMGALLVGHGYRWLEARVEREDARRWAGEPDHCEGMGGAC